MINEDFENPRKTFDQGRYGENTNENTNMDKTPWLPDKIDTARGETSLHS